MSSPRRHFPQLRELAQLELGGAAGAALSNGWTGARARARDKDMNIFMQIIKLFMQTQRISHMHLQQKDRLTCGKHSFIPDQDGLARSVQYHQ